MKAQLSGAKDVRPAASYEQAMLDEATGYWWFASEFGWTPTEVKAQPMALLRRIRMVGQVVAEVREEEQEKAIRKAQKGG